MCITRETGQSVRFPFGRRPSLETNGKKTPASSSILKYDGVNSRRPSPAFDTAPRVRVARQPFPPSSHSPFNLHAIPSFSPLLLFPRRPRLGPDNYTAGCTPDTRRSRVKAIGAGTDGGTPRGCSGEEKIGGGKEGRREGKEDGRRRLEDPRQDGWAPRSRRGNAKRRDESLKEGKKTG